MVSKESKEREKEKRVRKEKEKEKEKAMMIMMMIVMIVMRGRLKSLGRRKSFALQRFEPEHCTSSDDQEKRMVHDNGCDCKEIMHTCSHTNKRK